MCSLKENEVQESKRRFSLIRLIESSTQIISKVSQYPSIRYISMNTNHSLSIVACHPHKLQRNIETFLLSFTFVFKNKSKKIVTKEW